MTNPFLLENTGVVIKTNKSGGAHAYGDVCVEDLSNTNAVINDSGGAYADGIVWVCLETGGIADDEQGKYACAIKVPQINLDGSASLGDLVGTSTTPQQGTPHAPPMMTGDFAMVLGTGTTPPAVLFGAPKVANVGGGGAMVQKVGYETGAVNTGSTGIPNDDTIPQNTEGDEYMTLAITPNDAGNNLYITVTIHLSTDTATRWLQAALFQDSTANALAATMSYVPDIFHTAVLTFTHKMAAGTTSSTTFKVRAGLSNTGTTTFNGVNGSRYMGGVLASSITIEEVTP